MTMPSAQSAQSRTYGSRVRARRVRETDLTGGAKQGVRLPRSSLCNQTLARLRRTAAAARATVVRTTCAAASEALADPGVDARQRGRELGGLAAAGLRHVRATAALAAHLLRDVIDELARL